MKFRLSVEDLENLKSNYSNSDATAGFAEEYRWIGLPNYYVVILDNENIILVQMSLTFKEKDVTLIPRDSITSIKVSGKIQKRLFIESPNKSIDLVFKPLAIGKGTEQNDLIQALTDI